jgi:hypothetical protein
VETIEVHVPSASIGDELSRELGERGLRAELIDDGELRLRVSFADAHERLATDVTHTIEGWLADSELPLVAQRANGGFVVRPPGD